MGERFRAEMTVDAALSLDSRVKWVFAAYHIAGCDGCDRAPDETLEELARGYGIELSRLLSDLNSLNAEVARNLQ